jgi:hypothetical protein
MQYYVVGPEFEIYTNDQLNILIDDVDKCCFYGTLNQCKQYLVDDLTPFYNKNGEECYVPKFNDIEESKDYAQLTIINKQVSFMREIQNKKKENLIKTIWYGTSGGWNTYFICWLIPDSLFKHIVYKRIITEALPGKNINTGCCVCSNNNQCEDSVIKSTVKCKCGAEMCRRHCNENNAPNFYGDDVYSWCYYCRRVISKYNLIFSKLPLVDEDNNNEIEEGYDL